jgi:hypothetical protein
MAESNSVVESVTSLVQSNRTVTSHVPKTPLHGSLKRLIGGLDFKGKGTNHPLLSVDPFVLCDAAAELPGAGAMQLPTCLIAHLKREKV